MSADHSLLDAVLRAAEDAVLAFETVREAGGRIVDFRCTVANSAASRLVPPDRPWVGSLLKGSDSLLDTPALWTKFLALLNEGGSIRAKISLPAAEGARLMRLSAEPIANGFVAILREEDPSVSGAEARRANDQMIQAVFDTIPHPTFVKDRDSRYLLVNRAMAELWQVPADRILGHQVIASAERPNREASVALDTDRIVLETGALVDRVLTQTLPDGRERKMRIQKHPLRSEQREIIGLVGLAEDITDRLLADQAMRESEQRFRNLVEGSLQGIVVLQNQRMVFGNTAFFTMFGFDSEERVKRMRPEEFVAPHERERLKEYIRKRAAGEPAPFEYEMECLRQDGTRFWGYFMSRVVEWNGKPATQTAFLDITRRKVAEQALESSRHLLRSVIDTLPHGIFVKDLQGRYVLVNRAESDFHRLAPQLIVGRTAQEIPWPDLRLMAETLRGEQHVLAQGKPQGFDDLETVDADGNRTVRRLIQLPLHDDHGKLEGLVGLSLDRTAEVEARHDVQQAHAQLSDAIESFPGGIVLFDGNDRIHLWNSKVEELWPALSDLLAVGTTYEEFSRAVVEREEGLKGEVLEARMRALMTDVRLATRSRQFRIKDGRWFRFFVNRMTAGGTVMVMIETTESRRHEEDLRQAQKMEAIGQLTGGIAHDFNNLLTVILGNADFLIETLLQQSQAVACARMIVQAAQQGSALTQRLLAFARKQSLQPVELDLNRVVSGMGELIRRTLGEHIEIELIRGGGLWKTLADPSQFESALLNLAVNARDAMEAGGRLTIETANAWLDDSYAAAHGEVRPGQYVMMSVTDTGHGMTQEVAERAFDPFFTTKEPGRGTGLGLSMVYGFVKQSGGHVIIYTELGQGTSIKIYLPRHVGPAQEVDMPFAAEGPLPEGIETVLVVEDDELVRINTVRQLESLGYKVMAVEDARAALDMLERLERVHLLFTDVVMPGGMNGRQLAEEALRIWPGLKVLFASGYTPNAIVHHGRLDPGIHLVSKPYRKAELARKVRRVLDE